MSKTYKPETLARLQTIELMMLKDAQKVCEENHLQYWGFSGTGIGALRHEGFIPWDDDIDIYLPRADYNKLIEIMTTKFGDKYYALNNDTSAHYPLATTRLCLKDTVFQEEVMKNVDCPWGIFLDLYPCDNAADKSMYRIEQVWETWFWSKLVILYEMPRPTLPFTGVMKSLGTLATMLIHTFLQWLDVPKKYFVFKREESSQQYNSVRTRRKGYFCDTKPFANMFARRDTLPLTVVPFEDTEIPIPKRSDKLLRKMFGDYMSIPPIHKRKTHYPYKLEFGPYEGMTPEEIKENWTRI